MIQILKQSTQVTVTILMVDSADHVTGKTGLSAGLTIYLTKAGVSPAVITPTVVELDSTNVKGLYSLVLTTTHTNTVGEFQLHITASGADPTDIWYQVTARLLDDLCFPTTSGRSLDVTATGEAGIDWSNVGAPTTTLALTGTTIATTQQVDVNTIKTNPVVNGGTITFPTNATVASTTNITAGTVTTATNVTNVNGIANNVVTAAALATDAVTEIWANALTEPTAVVGASPTAIQALSWLLTLSRNKITQTATSQILKADDGSTTIATSTVSDDATTFTRGEFV